MRDQRKERTMALEYANLDRIELHADADFREGSVVRARSTDDDRVSQFFVHLSIHEALDVARGQVREPLQERARRVLEHWRTPDPEIVEAVKRLPWWRDVTVEADSPGIYNLTGTLVADPSVYFLAGNEDFEMCRPPCPESPWYVGLYRIDEQIDFTDKTTSVSGFVSALDELTRAFMKGKTPQDVAT